MSPKGGNAQVCSIWTKENIERDIKEAKRLSVLGPASPIHRCLVGLRIQAGRTEGRPNQAVGGRAEGRTMRNPQCCC